MANPLRQYAKITKGLSKADFIKNLGGDVNKLDDLLSNVDEAAGEAVFNAAQQAGDMTPDGIINAAANVIYPDAPATSPVPRGRKPRGKKETVAKKEEPKKRGRKPRAKKETKEAPASNVKQGENQDATDIGETPFEQFKREQPEAYQSIIDAGVMTDDDLAGFSMQDLMTTAEVGAEVKPSRKTPTVDTELEAELDANMPQSTGAGMALPSKRETDAAELEGYLDDMEEGMMPMGGTSPAEQQGGLFAGATPETIQQGLDSAEKMELDPNATLGGFRADTSQMQDVDLEALAELQRAIGAETPFQRPTIDPQPYPQRTNTLEDTNVIPSKGMLSVPPQPQLGSPEVIRMMQKGELPVGRGNPNVPTRDINDVDTAGFADVPEGLENNPMLGQDFTVKEGPENVNTASNWPATEGIRKLLGGSKAGDLVGTTADMIYGKDGRTLGGLATLTGLGGAGYMLYNAMQPGGPEPDTPEVQAAKKADFDAKVQAVREQFINKDMR